MLVVFGFALLVLAVAVVVLFAMIGELAARVPAAETGAGWVRPTDEARLGSVPEVWPPELAHAPDRDTYVLLVLSTVCNSCKAVAAQLVDGQADWDGVGIVVSTASRRNGDDFVAERRLGGFVSYVDESGSWSREQLGVESSPTAVVLRRGRVVAAYAFSDLALLRSEVDDRSRPSEAKEAV